MCVWLNHTTKTAKDQKVLLPKYRCDAACRQVDVHFCERLTTF